MVHKPQKIVHLVAHEVRFKQGSSWINHEAGVVVEFDFFLDVGRHDGRPKTKFEQVDFVGIDFQEVLCLTKAKAFVHDHGQSRFTGLVGALRKMGEVVIHTLGFHALVAAGHARIVEETWVGFQQLIHAIKVRKKQVVKEPQGFSIQPQSEQTDKLFVPQRCRGGWDMLECIVEQNQRLIVGLQCLHVVDAFLPRFHVLGVAFQQLDKAGVCFLMAPHLLQNGGHHQQGVFMVGVEQKGLGHVLQGS